MTPRLMVVLVGAVMARCASLSDEIATRSRDQSSDWQKLAAMPRTGARTIARMMTCRRAAVGLAVVALLGSGCATKIAEYRNTAGDVRRCQHNDEALAMTFILGVTMGAAQREGERYATCKAVLEHQGYVRTPAGQENEETKQMIRDMDAARGASIRKP